VKTALEQGKNVVVTNTFTQMWELERYIDLGYPFRILEATGSGPNVRGVSKRKVERMKARWDSLSKVLQLAALRVQPKLARKAPTIRYKPRAYTTCSPNMVDASRNHLRNYHA